MSKTQFDLEESGFKKEQVERYLEKIEIEYRHVLEAYETLKTAHEQQKTELENVRQETSTEAAAAVMLKAEMLARHTTGCAEKEAERILEKARKDAAEIRSEAERGVEELTQSKNALYAELHKIGQVVNYLTDTEGQSTLRPAASQGVGAR